jgi:hypothetical protein
MTRPLVLLAAVIVVGALAAPTVEAQATRRGGATAAPPSGGGGGGGSRVAVPRGSSPQPAPGPRSDSGRPATRRSSVGAGTTRSATAPAAAGEERVSPTARVNTPGVASARPRSTQATRGVAQPRPIGSGYPVQPIYPAYPSYGYGYPYYGYGYPYYGYGYPYYGYGYGWGVSFGYGYPWYNGWHDPFFYAPSVHIHAPYYWSSSASEGNEVAESPENRPRPVATGSLRLRVNPGHASVYVDGALAGVASAFGGLTDHLVLPAGTHELELRADGYQTSSLRVEVKPDRTQTERISLNRQ